MRTGGGLSSLPQRLVPCYQQTTDVTELPTRQNKEVSCVMGLLYVKHESVLKQGTQLLQSLLLTLLATPLMLQTYHLYFLIIKLIHVCYGENIRKYRQLRREKGI